MYKSWMFIVCLGVGLNVHAQTASDLQGIQQQQEQLLNRAEQAQAEQKKGAGQTVFREAVVAEETEIFSDESAPCFTLTEINLHGLSAFKPEQMNSVTAPHLGECATMGDIQGLVKELRLKYMDAGYVTSQVLLEPQNIQDGVLDIALKEGFLAGVELPPASQKLLNHAFPKHKYGLLNLRDLEQGLDNVNRLGKQPGSMQLKPGANPRSKPW